MRRLSWIVMAALVLGALAWCRPISSGMASQVKGPEGAFAHTVIFWLKKEAPAGEADALIADAHTLLAKIPSVRGLRAGKPANPGTPQYAVKDYQVGLLVLFDDQAGLEAYLKHPLHDQYVQKHGDHLEKVVVYDFIDKK